MPALTLSRSELDFVEKHKQAINAMIEKYSVGLDGPVDGVLPRSHAIKPAVVLLTGTTGGLGSFLLLELLNSPVVQRVYAFNRPSSIGSIEERQMSAFRERSLPADMLDSPKLVHVVADASLDKCGLDPIQYEEIRDSVTLIIHNAWPLNFKFGLSAFEDNVRASRNLVDLGLASTQKESLRFLFTSSIASAQAWDNLNGLFPEEVQLDPSVAVGLGYGEGKYVTERIIVKSGLHATSLRIGQITGGSDGSWSPTDWFPTIVTSSIALGTLPETDGVFSWLREEDVSSTILEIAFADEAPPPALNIVNPRGASCPAIMASVRRALVRHMPLTCNEGALRIIPFQEWFKTLEEKARNLSKEELSNIPTIRLLGLWRLVAKRDQLATFRAASGILPKSEAATEVLGVANFSTTEAERLSVTLANMQAVGDAEVDAWVRYWISRGAPLKMELA